MSRESLFDGPRWLNGPKVCKAANLPAFESARALDDFLKENSPSCKVVRKYECEACQCWHAYVIAPDPAGASSGTGRSSKWKSEDEWRAFFAAASPGELVAVIDELERKEAACR